jgi:hypothetical protein
MNRLWVCVVALIVGLGAGRWLLADENTGMPAGGNGWAEMNNRVWYIEQEASIAKDPEAMGIYAVQKASELMEDQPLESQTDFFQKMLFDAKSHGAQREIRMKLVELYKRGNRMDKAMEQIEALVTETPS